MDNKPWLTHYPQQVPPRLEYPDVALTDFLIQAAKDYPDHPAIRFLGKTVTYRELQLEVKRFADLMKKLGMLKGDRIAIMLPNCPQAVIGYYGVLWAGGVVVETNPLYTERELIHQLNDSDAEMILCLDLVYPRIKKIKNQTKLREIIVTGIQDFLPFPKNLLYPLLQMSKGSFLSIFREKDYLKYKEVMKTASMLEKPEMIDPHTELALLQYTGGTTGISKGVMLTHANMVANVMQCRAWFYKAEKGQEKFLAAIPFFHVYGLTVAMNLAVCLAGCLVTIPRFDVRMILKAIHKEKPTVFPGAPTMYIGLLNHPDLRRYNISSIDACLSGSAALPSEIQEKFEEKTGGRLVEGYGLTECSPVTHANPIWGRRKNGSIGLPWPDTDARIIHIETGEEMEPGQIGELVIRGPQVMKGYWKQPEETKQVIRNGWLYTGDLAYMDEEGYFFIVDRRKDLIIASGFNIYPREIEEVLFEHPQVIEAAVIGMPDPYRGETVKAFIVLRTGAAVTEEELDAFCRERLAAYKVPKKYEFRTELPKTIVGKVLKRVLQESKEGST